MAVLHNYRDPAVNMFRKQFQEAAQWWGEPAILLSMWNAQNAENQNPPVERCPQCWSGTYGQANPKCPVCFGTGWKGGIRKAWFANVLRTNPAQTNRVDKKQGHLAGEEATLDIPWQADMWEFDFVLFVNGWSLDPNEPGAYLPDVQEAWKIAAPPQTKYLKDGSSNYAGFNKISSKCQIKRVNMDLPVTAVHWASLPSLNSDAFFAPTPSSPSGLGVVMSSSSISNLNS